MPRLGDVYTLSSELVLGTHLNERVPQADQKRQRAEVVEILRRLRAQPGVVLADEVGMGKTFVALAIACNVALRSHRGPVIVMVPANLVDKWEQDLKTFCELYLENSHTLQREGATRRELREPGAVRYGVARHSVDLLKLLDDPPGERCHMIFLAQGAMSRQQTDKWIRLALIAEALRRHGRGRAKRLIQVKKQIHRYLAELLWAIGVERAHDWGDELWQHLLRTTPESWREIYNRAARKDRRLPDDPVPKSVSRALHQIDLAPLAEALKWMPVRARGGDTRVSERLDDARVALRRVEERLWKDLLAQARWRSPLLVMDEAHHLKNPGTALARQLQSPDTEKDLRTGDGALAGAFDRMLFLTATPFQLGHHELVSVLERFGDVRWNVGELGERDDFRHQLIALNDQLNASQRAAIALQRSWSWLRPEDGGPDVDVWWERLLQSSRESLSNRQRAVVDAYHVAKRCRDGAEKVLRPWVVRHNKGTYWMGTDIARRQRVDGAALIGDDTGGGLLIPPRQLLPFFLAARSAIAPGQDLLGEALSSSYEAFRFTRENRRPHKDEQQQSYEMSPDLSHSHWYLEEFDRALEHASGSTHPKIHATVQQVVRLWELGEKVLVFAFYRRTCQALRIHISAEIERRIALGLQQTLREVGRDHTRSAVKRVMQAIQRRFFDNPDARGRRALDTALEGILHEHAKSLDAADVSMEQRKIIKGVMRRFLRVPTTLVRCFPVAEMETLKPSETVERTLSHVDESGISWRRKFDKFIDFLTHQCSTNERELYVEAARRTQTGGIRVEGDVEGEGATEDSRVTLANVQVATGATRRETRVRLMRAFNTPFFPDILVCSQVMGEGVDLQRFCRHVIHHDLDWNPSTIEQRTGRIDRLGCKAQDRHPIVVYLPYLAGTADERQYRVMSDREQWFRVVMGQDEVARLITPDSSSAIPLPDAVSEDLSFDLGLGPSGS